MQTSVPVQDFIESVTPRVARHLGGCPCLELVLGASSTTVLKLTDEIILSG